jgi:hypothetical protein
LHCSVVERVDDDPAGAFFGIRKVAPHQRDLVAESSGFARRSHPLANPQRGRAGEVDKDVVTAEAGTAQGFNRLRSYGASLNAATI